MMDINELGPDISVKYYRKLRRQLEHKEHLNYDRIYIIPCSGNHDWYEIAEHSALIYYYKVCQPLSLKTKFFADHFSFYDPYEIGYIRSKGIDHIRDNLKKAGLYKNESTEDEITAIKLNITLTEQEMDELKELEKARRLKNLTVGETGNLDPELHQLLVASSIRLHRLCNAHLDKLASITNGAKIVTIMDGLLMTYHQTALIKKDADKRTLENLIKMRKDIYDLIVEVKIVGEAKLWDFEVVSSVSEALFQIRDNIERDIGKYNKELKGGASKSSQNHQGN